MCRRASAGRAVFLIRGVVIIAVVDAVADRRERDAPPVAASELRGAVAVPEQAPRLIAVVATVVIVIAAVAIGDTSPVATREGH